MPEDQARSQADEGRQPSFRWQLSDVLTLSAAFAFAAVGTLDPPRRWAIFVMWVIVGWWTYRCLKAERQPSVYQIAALCISIGVYVVVVGLIRRLMG